MNLLCSVQTQADTAPLPWPLVLIGIAAVVLSVAVIWLPSWLDAWRDGQAAIDAEPEPTDPPYTTARTTPASRQESRT